MPAARFCPAIYTGNYGSDTARRNSGRTCAGAHSGNCEWCSLFYCELLPGARLRYAYGAAARIVTLTVIASLIPISIAGVRLALVIRHAREHGACVLPAPGVVNRSIVCAFIVNLVFIVLGSVASMGWLLAAVVPYLLISAVPLACTAAILGWGAEKLLTRTLSKPAPSDSDELSGAHREVDN